MDITALATRFSQVPVLRTGKKLGPAELRKSLTNAQAAVLPFEPETQRDKAVQDRLKLLYGTKQATNIMKQLLPAIPNTGQEGGARKRATRRRRPSTRRAA
jgi:hypothetical protein